MTIREVGQMHYDQTLLHARGGQLTVGVLLERLAKVDPSMPVCVSGDGFNFIELNDNGVMVVGDQVVIGLHHEFAQAAA
jgi:hypothetical protein